LDSRTSTRRLAALLGFATLLAGHGVAGPVPGETRFPAEFDPQESVWISWPRAEGFVDGLPVVPVVARIVGELAPFVPVDLLVPGRREGREALEYLEENGFPSAHVRLHVVRHAELWLRDLGPAFLLTDGELAAVDFGFDGWGYAGGPALAADAARKLEGTDRAIAEELRIPAVRSPLVGEGGGRESNGRGTLLLVEELEARRNPGLSREAIAEGYRTVLGVRHVIWLREALLEDQPVSRGVLPENLFASGGPGGHVDEFARFAGPSTVLLAEVPQAERDASPLARINGERLEENHRILREARDQDGNPLTIVRMPIPDPIVVQTDSALHSKFVYEDGTVVRPDGRIQVLATASYLNFLVTNGAVLVSAYWQPGRPDSTHWKDERARQILESVFPGRKVLQIPAEPLNFGGGGIHCVTLPQPRAGGED
jgi:agmatine deiminase